MTETVVTQEMQEEMARAVGLKQNYWTKEWFTDPHTSIGNPDLTDLTNLFKYVEPELWRKYGRIKIAIIDEGGRFGCEIHQYGSQTLDDGNVTMSGWRLLCELEWSEILQAENAGAALFLACWKLLKEEK